MSRRTKQEMYPLMESWKSSGQRKTEFCGANQVNIHTFNYWLQKYESEPGSSTQGKVGEKFISLQVTESSGGYVELYYPNGVRVRVNISGEVSAPYLASLIHLPV